MSVCVCACIFSGPLEGLCGLFFFLQARCRVEQQDRQHKEVRRSERRRCKTGGRYNPPWLTLQALNGEFKGQKKLT